MILVNGQAQEHIPVADRGLQYGDGLFETLAVRAGSPRLWDRHWHRLSAGCRRLGIEGIEEQTLREEAARVCAGVARGVLKIIITRGTGGRGYRPATADVASRIVTLFPWPDYPDRYWREGITARICSTRLGRNSALAGLKHLNRLEQVMARREWDDPRIAEGLMLDDQDTVIAGTMTNLFLVSAGGLLTPRLGECGVEGVMRGVILEIAAEEGIPCDLGRADRQALHQASELFLSNALIGIWPVRRLGRQEYAIGPITRLISKGMSELLLSSEGRESH